MKKDRLLSFVGILSMLLLFSCANVERLIDEGNYEKALDISVKKVSGKKKKKEKYVRYVEEAFDKLSKREMAKMNKLRQENNAANWDDILFLANRIENEQNKLKSLLPLVDQYGYKADFDFIRTEKIQKEARLGAANFYYTKGNNLLVAGRNGDKIKARKAYTSLNKVKDFQRGFKNTNALIKEAKYIGTSFVLVDVKNVSHSILPRRLENSLTSLDLNSRADRWTSYHYNAADKIKYDYLAKIYITDIEVSPESINENVHYYSKDIDKIVFLKDRRGNFIVDSLGKKIEVVETQTIQGRVEEVLQFKEAILAMNYEMIDLKTKRSIDFLPISAVSTFDNKACRVFGDKRAIDKQWNNIGRPKNFPLDEDLLFGALEEVENKLSTHLKRNNVII